FIAVVPYKVRLPRAKSYFSMDRFTNWLIRYRSRILPATVGFSLMCAAFIPLIEFDDSFVEFFDKSVPFRIDTEFTIENISGIYQLHYSLGARHKGGVSDPKFLAKVDEFAGWLRDQAEVDHVTSLSDTIKRLNKNMHGDDPKYYRLPDEQALTAQYLLMYEMSLPYGLDLNNQIDIHKSATRVTATVKNLSATQLRAFNNRASAWLQENADPSMWGSAASASFMLANLSRRSIDSMVRGTSIAFGLIALILVIALRSIRIGLLSLVPNILPIAIAYGIWALLVGKVGMVFAIVTASSLGIIVDATVHFMSKYMRARRTDQASPEDAVRYAIATVGPALLTTFLILAAGFAVLSFSTFKLNEDFGLLTSVTILAALAADFLLLPTLLMRLDRRAL
ncbi:MAG: putative RND superfamily exporter protein, partial [Gammaproteobacteria bacterium]